MSSTTERQHRSGDRGAGRGGTGCDWVRQVLHRPHGHGDLGRGPGMARRDGGPVPAAVDRPGVGGAARQPDDLRGAEGLPPPRRVDRVFRPWANAERMARSAERLAMPPLPEDLFLDSIRELLAVDARWVPADGRRGVAVPAAVHVRVVLGAGGAAQRGVPLPAHRLPGRRLLPARAGPGERVALHRLRPRGAGRHRRGEVRRELRRVAGRAGPGLRAGLRPGGVARRARAPLGGGDGRDEPVLRLHRRATGHHEVVTPELSGSLLPGITRRSLLELAREDGATVTERRISTDEWEKEVASGALTEVFACGTAAVITPVGSVKYDGGSFEIGDGTPGPVTARLRERLTAIQRGAAPGHARVDGAPGLSSGSALPAPAPPRPPRPMIISTLGRSGGVRTCVVCPS